MDWNSLLLSTGILICLVSGLGAIWRVYFSPLSKFPGSKAAAITLWNEFYWDVVKRGTFMWKIQDMHAKYGPIVRINPYELHVNDPDFYNELYASNRKLDKYQWWTNLAGGYDRKSAFATVSHDHHRLRRGALATFFSQRSVTQLEPLIRSKVDRLCDRFSDISQTGTVVRLDAAFMALTMDIISDLAFADDRRYIDKPDFELEWKHTVIGAMEAGALNRQFPWLAAVVQVLPLSVVGLISPPLAYLMRWEEDMVAQVKPILAHTDEISRGLSTSHTTTIFHELRDNPDLPPEEKTIQRLTDEAEILIGAGSETTAQALTRIFFYLKHVPAALARLREELDAAIPNAAVIPSWGELQKLPYLTAVIREGLRLSYGVTTRLPRITQEDLHYKEFIIPAGTPVSMTPYFVLTDLTIFPEPTEFRPERWIEAAAQGGRLDKYLVSFGRGSRSCVGINLAYAELYLAMGSVVRRFDWDMYETGLKDIVCKHDFFVPGPDLSSKGVRATISKRKE